MPSGRKLEQTADALQINLHLIGDRLDELRGRLDRLDEILDRLDTESQRPPEHDQPEGDKPAQ